MNEEGTNLPSGVPDRGLEVVCKAQELPDRLLFLSSWGKPVLEPDLETVRLELDPDSLEMGLELLLFLLACLRQGGSACC